MHLPNLVIGLGSVLLFLLFAYAAVMVVLRLFWPHHRATRWLQGLAPVSPTWLMPFLFAALLAGIWMLGLVESLISRFWGG